MNLSSVFKSLRKFNATEPIYVYNNKCIMASPKGFVIVHNSYNAPEGLYTPEQTSHVTRGYDPSPSVLYPQDIDAIESIFGYNNNVVDNLTIFTPRIFARTGGKNSISENIIISNGELTTVSDCYIVSTVFECPQANESNLNGLYSSANAKIARDLEMDILEARVLANSISLGACDCYGDVWDIELIRNHVSSFTSAIASINRIWNVYDTEKTATIYGACEIRKHLWASKLDTYEPWCEERPEYAYIFKANDDKLWLRVGQDTRTSEVLFEMDLDADVNNTFVDIKMPLNLFIEMVADASPNAVIEIPKIVTEPMLVKDVGYSKGGMFSRKW
jgi:hypothetical protein